ncbi:hypothetical protein [Paracoccus tegillarcae]|uniref:DUF3325 domain-containing protein n=1 Tax=Paracoccus tegillarcae TaxID=1529068 RepID=A0A2K9EJ63_9RHOB|nr:hypothetical protein [Paracoccus tegillarcae]AUH35033.1 hypothetical protein CUV01_18100 [Paracoccus tegillarcae]
MLASFINFLSWAVALLLIAVTVLLAMNKQSGLKMIQHRAEMLPQALLIRYGALTLLALISSWMGSTRLTFAFLLSIAVISLGDVFIYRRAGHPFQIHLIIGGVAGLGALLSLFAMN